MTTQRNPQQEQRAVQFASALALMIILLGMYWLYLHGVFDGLLHPTGPHGLLNPGGTAELTRQDCAVVQTVADRTYGDEQAIDIAIALQVLHDDPQKPDGELATDGLMASIHCGTRLPAPY